MNSEMNLVVIGGGSGLSVLLSGLKTKFSNITAVVTVADDGGGSGVLREDLGMLPPGDIRNCIIALANTEPTMKELLKYRFDSGRLKGQSFGNLLIAAMNGISENFEHAIKKISEILAVKGKVLPVTMEDVHLIAELENGKKIRGESYIPTQVIKEKSRIKEIFYDREDVEALPEVIQSIYSADIILVGPGSLFTSIIPNIIIPEVKKALINTKSKKIYLANLMTQPGETDDFTIKDHLDALEYHLGRNVFDYLIANNGVIESDVKENYKRQGSEFLKLTSDERRIIQTQMEVYEANLVEVVKGYVRHDSKKIATLLPELIDVKIFNKS